MLKVVVVGGLTGGEMFANYLEDEMQVLEVIRELDPIFGDSGKHGKHELTHMVEGRLKRYIGEVNLIFLASYSISHAALLYLQEKYPEQKFMGFKPRLAGELRGYVAETDGERYLREYKSQLGLKKRIKFILEGYEFIGVGRELAKFLDHSKRDGIIVLANENVKNSREYREDKKCLGGKIKIVEPNCEYWAKCLDAGMDVENETIQEFSHGYNVKAVLIYNATFVPIKDRLKDIFGWKVEVCDDFKRSVHDISVVLEMRRAG